MGGLAALTLAGYRYAFDIIAWAMQAFSPTESGYLGFTLVAQSVAVALMVPVTFCAGMTLPLITRLQMTRGAGERAIGAVYSVNTVGAIVGVRLAIHLLMPTIGVKGTIVTGAALHLLLAISGLRLAWHGPFARPDRLLVVASVLTVAFVASGDSAGPQALVVGSVSKRVCRGSPGYGGNVCPGRQDGDGVAASTRRNNFDTDERQTGRSHRDG